MTVKGLIVFSFPCVLALSRGLDTPANADDDSPDKPFTDGVSIYSTKGGKRQHREWYSSSYTSVWHMPVFCHYSIFIVFMHIEYNYIYIIIVPYI